MQLHGVIVGGKIILSKGYGYRDLTLKLPVTEDTVFGIGSCTKAFTAFILGQLVDEKIISWDDSIVKYIPELCLWDKCTTQSTTVRDLLAHRTGFSGHDFLAFNIHLSRKDLVERLQYLEPIDSFRNSYHYSNIMYALAGHLIERVTGMTWEVVVNEKILKPLMMNNSCFYESVSIQIHPSSDILYGGLTVRVQQYLHQDL